MVGALEEVLVQIHKDCDSEDNIHMNVTVEIINELGDVGCDPAVFFISPFVLYSALLIDPRRRSDWMGKAIDACVTFAAATIFTLQMISPVSHEFFDLGS